MIPYGIIIEIHQCLIFCNIRFSWMNNKNVNTIQADPSHKQHLLYDHDPILLYFYWSRSSRAPSEAERRIITLRTKTCSVQQLKDAIQIYHTLSREHCIVSGIRFNIYATRQQIKSLASSR